MQVATLDFYRVDFDFIPQFDSKLIARRSFSKAFSSDSTKALVINRGHRKTAWLPVTARGCWQKVQPMGPGRNHHRRGKDFHFRSLRENVKPLTFRLVDPWNGELLSVKLDDGNVKRALETIEAQWKIQYPDRPFTYYFSTNSMTVNTALTSVLKRFLLQFRDVGHFHFMPWPARPGSPTSTAQRTKEIGVRKVMGASAASIVGLLSKDFVKLVGLAFRIAAPLAWFAMHRWLEGFAYKTDIRAWIFIAAALLSALVALATISFQSIRAAFMNPVKSLRSE